ncbi:hypothetical protein UU9_12268 [Rhodanobacter fulvus Jip2]|uniref:Bacteriophage protein n=1 Tax=Rhodanobacter fulvus Jip2 TaxID=1163408 RepID=I4VMT2_9GAMM|nr:hypothetical protein UU9_12268 [Rhodanobacter fulvus Jip2]
MGTDAGDGLDLSQLRVTFEVRNATINTPKYALIRVYNLAAEKMARIINEFTQVVLQAGYIDPGPSTIFEGQIVMTRRGRYDTDTFIEITAQDADQAHNYGVISTTLVAGWTWDDVYNALLGALGAYGVTGGNKPSFSTEKGLRGKQLDGMVSAQLTMLANNQNCDWYIEDNKLTFLEKGATLPGEVPMLNSGNGLLSVPDQTVDGVIISCLLRPQIRAGMMIKVDNKQLLDGSDAQVKVRQDAFRSNEYVYVPDVSADGSYKAACVTHVGDTRGDDWVTEIICVNLASPSLSAVTTEAVPDAR